MDDTGSIFVQNKIDHDNKYVFKVTKRNSMNTTFVFIYDKTGHEPDLLIKNKSNNFILRYLQDTCSRDQT